MREGTNITIRDVLIKKFGLEGISISNGMSISRNVSLIRIRTQKVRRTAIHFGQNDNVSLVDSSIEDMGSDEWLPALVGNPAIDIEPEGLDLDCPAIPENYHDPYVFNSTIRNTLIKNPTNTTSKGGMSVSPAYGAVRNVVLDGNVWINTTGVATLGIDSSVQQYGIRHPCVGQSKRIRQVSVTSNWLSNLHTNSQQPPDPTSHAAQVMFSGDVADGCGANDVQLNNNVMTMTYDGYNHRALSFSGVKEFYGNNNKVFRPYHDTTGNPLAGNLNFVWDKSFTPVDPSNMQITNTLDNGWPGSRLACVDYSQNPAWFFCSLPGAGNLLTWIDNPNPTPTTPPTINSASVWFPRVLISASEPNNQPMRVMIFRNGLPEGLRTIQSGTPTFISLSSKPNWGDTFYIQAFNENGLSDDYSFTYGSSDS